MRLLPTRLALIALVAGFVSMVGPAAPAGAAPVPCVRTINGAAANVAPDAAGDPPFTSTAIDLQAPVAPGLVEDVDVSVSLDHPDAYQVRVRLSHAGTTSILQRRFADSGPQVRPLTWDDEAAAVYGPTSTPGTYRPDQPLSAHDGAASGGAWRLLVDNWGAAAGRVVSWSITISYTACDGDDDGVEDHVDNCDPVANPDQSDIDRDGIGDACDGDPDGDGVGSQADNCPQVSNATQVNSDADALGDACDADDDDDSRADVSDGCPLVGAATSSGCPAVATKVRLRKEKSRLVGRVRSDRGACVDQVRATVKRKKPGRDPKLVVVMTKPDGRFRTRLPKAAGRYYVVVRKRYAVGVAECGSSRSAAVRVRR
ncbi:thrombospondin type 3 repeat-containing protein [Nocardioides baculatus]|uniref:Thrombospondin type 3 repeat-containing protein n=1 Tax=Nocardioides baculatus TaxID=2801337 RepID=A0ABS1LC33_9ACTN|nr:thrombospondin type 3 repeat-containing protein [Nocardioides baculatus]